MQNIAKLAKFRQIWSHWPHPPQHTSQWSLFQRGVITLKLFYQISSCSWCYKTIFGGNLDFPKINQLKKNSSDESGWSKMPGRCHFMHNKATKLFIAFKMDYFCCFSSGGNQDFPDFLQKKFYKLNYSVTFACLHLQKYYLTKLQSI